MMIVRRRGEIRRSVKEKGIAREGTSMGGSRLPDETGRANWGFLPSWEGMERESLLPERKCHVSAFLGRYCHVLSHYYLSVLQPPHAVHSVLPFVYSGVVHSS